MGTVLLGGLSPFSEVNRKELRTQSPGKSPASHVRANSYITFCVKTTPLRAGPGATPLVMSHAKSNGKSKCKMLSKMNRMTIRKSVRTTNSKMVGTMARKMFLTMLWSFQLKTLRTMVWTIERKMVGKSFLKSVSKSCLMTLLNSLLTTTLRLCG